MRVRFKGSGIVEDDYDLSSPDFGRVHYKLKAYSRSASAFQR